MGNCLKSTEDNNTTCSVCYEICHVRTVCNHILCDLCSEQLTDKKCPICRHPLVEEASVISLDDIIEQLNGGYPYQLVRQNEVARLEEWLIQNPSQINNSKMLELTLLHDACIYAKYDCVKILIKYGADVNAANCMGLTALHFACGNQNIDIVVALLAAGANKYAKTQAHQTPLDHSKIWKTNYLLSKYVS